jgi:hypothetical protein
MKRMKEHLIMMDLVAENYWKEATDKVLEKLKK